MEAKKKVIKVDVDKYIKNRLLIEDIAWAAFKELIDSTEELVINEELKHKFDLIVNHIMKLPFKERREYVRKRIASPYVYNKRKYNEYLNK